MPRSDRSIRVSATVCFSRCVSSLVSQTSIAGQPASAKWATSSANEQGSRSASLRQGCMSILARRLVFRQWVEAGGDLGELVSQVFCQIDALQEQKRKAGIDNIVRARPDAYGPTALRRLMRPKNRHAPVIPLLVVNLAKLIKHGDALERPEEVHVGRRSLLLGVLGRFANEAA